MVDINLFDDELEEENEKQEDPSFDNTEDLGGLDLGDDLSGESLETGDDLGAGLGDDELSGESLDDALGFDDDLSGGDDLETEAMLEDDLGDLDEGEAGLEDDDYDFGGGQRKKVSPVLWLLMVIVVGLAVIYLFRPELLPIPGGSTEKPGRRVTQTAPGAKKPGAAQKKPQGASAVQGTQPGGTAGSDSGRVAATQIGAGAKGSVPVSIASSVKILNNLADEGRFAMLMADQDRFTVEYASPSQGVADTFGARLKQLTGAESYTASPEDRHTVNGQTIYFGVISGMFDSAKKGGATGNPFASENAFVNAVKSRIQQQGLKETGQKKRSSQSRGDLQQVNYEWILEGDRAKVAAFLQSLAGLPGMYEPVKILISPASLNDFQAQKAKLVLDLRATIGKTQASASKPAM